MLNWSVLEKFEDCLGILNWFLSSISNVTSTMLKKLDLFESLSNTYFTTLSVSRNNSYENDLFSQKKFMNRFSIVPCSLNFLQFCSGLCGYDLKVSKKHVHPNIFCDILTIILVAMVMSKTFILKKKKFLYFHTLQEFFWHINIPETKQEFFFCQNLSTCLFRISRIVLGYIYIQNLHEK